MNRVNSLLTCLAFAAIVNAEPSRYDFECDTPAGHFSFWQRTTSGGEITVAGMMTVHEVRKDRKWSAVANIVLTTHTDARRRFGIHVYADRSVSDQLFLSLLKVGGQDPIGLGFLPRGKDPIPFKLKLDASGLLTASVAGVEASTPLGAFKPEKLELACSTGDFHFSNIVVSD